MTTSEENSRLLNIDWLRSFKVEPVYFGLGFIRLKIRDNERLHFYHNDLPVLAEEPHTHRYNFTSYILQGKLYQNIYHFNPCPVGEYELTNVSCDPNVDVTPEAYDGELMWTMEAEHCEGSHYNINKDTLHTVRATDNCITHLVREEPELDFPWMVRKKGEEMVCPFSQPMTTKRCWEMIEEMLPGEEPEKKKKKKKKFGYHVMDIPKGTVGEPSKIVEEALEIMDAHEQGVRIMAEVEMSDLYGALDRYREKYYPDLTMDDIERMYRVTRRAFDNGKRK